MSAILLKPTTDAHYHHRLKGGQIENGKLKMAVIYEFLFLEVSLYL